MNLAEIREKHRLKLLEEKIMDRIEERNELTNALSRHLEIDHKEQHELRMYELGLDVTILWTEYRKLVASKQDKLDKYLG